MIENNRNRHKRAIIRRPLADHRGERFFAGPPTDISSRSEDKHYDNGPHYVRIIKLVSGRHKSPLYAFARVSSCFVRCFIFWIYRVPGDVDFERCVGLR